MRRAGIVVDVLTIRLVVDYIGVCAECVKNGFCNVPGATIGAVQTNLDTLEGIDTQRDQIPHVTIASGHIIHSAADMLTMSKRQFQPVPVKYMELAIDVVLYQQQRFFRHLLAVAVDQLDAVIIVGVMAGGDHNTAVEVIHTGDICYRRSGSDVE